ncbi:hypothetical protein PMI07_006659 [Rhizobium sp. CF080]|uniref:hypothetical protein n=1 Tax=Rhizobium sp. (strain CF080) TaxID=1144310 RepID=UPI0002715690|nr:hypothetical protein [Rhizobium sp. CF080]EUB98345.1 hypothetical protein PMI07_006659 [Rhizobium sp. CF080]
MTRTGFLKSLLMAPLLAFAGMIVGLIFSGLLLLANFLVHLIRGVDHGEIRQEIGAIARYLPIVTGVACPRLFCWGHPAWLHQPRSTKKHLGDLCVGDLGERISNPAEMQHRMRGTQFSCDAWPGAFAPHLSRAVRKGRKVRRRALDRKRKAEPRKVDPSFAPVHPWSQNELVTRLMVYFNSTIWWWLHQKNDE